MFRRASQNDEYTQVAERVSVSLKPCTVDCVVYTFLLTSNFTQYGMDAMIYRLILLACAVHVSCGSAAIGNDYILRIDKIESTHGLTSAKEPSDATTCSIEVVARPHSSFHGRASVGGETVSIVGKLRPADEGKFVAEFRFGHLVDTGATVPSDDGTRKPVVGKSVAQTSITVPVGIGVDTHGLVMKDSKTQQSRQIRLVVTLLRYEALND